jgi:pyruvate dehydrogenase E2 component (dihydrolipoamide acetyltransferase)
MVEFTMPILGADMTAGTLIAWRKQPGDRIKRGEIIAEVETDKGLIDVEVFVSGVIERLVVEPGATVPTGTVLALIVEDEPVGEAVPPQPLPPVVSEAVAPPRAAVLAAEPALRAAAPVIRPVAPAPSAAAPRVRISPAARKLADELGITAALLSGTGPGGVVTREDVERAAAARTPAPARVPAEAPAAAPGVAAVDRHARMRRTIAAAMARSKREIPHYYLATTIDLHRALAWLTEENATRPVTERLLYGVLLVKAVALALHEVPELNAVWDGEHAVPQRAVHVGVAISLRGGGLVAPALHDTDQRSLDDLMRDLRDLVQRARSGGLKSSELSAPTITVTSLGEQGVESVFGIIYPPQVAIVGFGKVVERPWVVDGAVAARPVVSATLSADHRVSDGHRGGLFLAAVDRVLQTPEKL